MDTREAMERFTRAQEEYEELQTLIARHWTEWYQLRKNQDGT